MGFEKCKNAKCKNFKKFLNSHNKGESNTRSMYLRMNI